jgi:hypothetical protein
LDTAFFPPCAEHEYNPDDSGCVAHNLDRIKSRWNFLMLDATLLTIVRFAMRTCSAKQNYQVLVFLAEMRRCEISKEMFCHRFISIKRTYCIPHMAALSRSKMDFQC